MKAKTLTTIEQQFIKPLARRGYIQRYNRKYLWLTDKARSSIKRTRVFHGTDRNGKRMDGLGNECRKEEPSCFDCLRIEALKQGTVTANA